MTTITLGGSPVSVSGSFPAIGATCPDFTLTAKDLKDVHLADYAGKRKVLNIVPSLDTPVCAQSTRVFNDKAAALANTMVLVIAADLPFAMGRFCGAESLERVIPLSTFRGKEFHENFGVSIADGPLRGLTARAVIVLDQHDKVLHAQLVNEIKQEPDYERALAVLT